MSTNAPLEAYFSSYQNFAPSSHSIPPFEKFAELKSYRGWSDRSKTYKRARRSFVAAFLQAYHSPVDRIFANFVENHRFEYDPTANSTATEQWRKLEEHMCWGERNRNRKRARKEFLQAIEEEITPIGDGSDKEWAGVCRVLEIEPIPLSKTALKKILAGVFVNIFDVLHAMRHGGPVERFQSLRKLAGYSVDSDKVYPKAEAKRDIMKVLLKRLFHVI